jgi:GNAT superfamily N-acetyltransferase
MLTPTSEIRAVSLAERPELEEIFWPNKRRIWPEFMFHDVFADRFWHYLDEYFRAFQIYLTDQEDRPIAVVQTIPLTWDGTPRALPVGWDDMFGHAVRDVEAGRAPDTLGALEAAVLPEYQGRGLGYRLVTEARETAAQHGFHSVIVAVRPSLKHRYPLTPMQQYMRWTQADGAPFDPWLRVHWRLGGKILHMAHPSMVIDGTVDEWEAWTGMAFPESADYVVPRALAPIHIDRVADLGRYIEPNVWVHHSVSTAA